jgi:HAMP domain-containing protein
MIRTIALAAFLLGIGSVMALTRNVVPRIRRYSSFAASVASGDLRGRLDAPGSDELAMLGRALDEMVEHRAIDTKHQEVQIEFVETLQVTDSEELAHDLLKRHVERSIASSTVVVLNRNNSENRLEATTALSDDSWLNESLIDAKLAPAWRCCSLAPTARIPSVTRSPIAPCAEKPVGATPANRCWLAER